MKTTVNFRMIKVSILAAFSIMAVGLLWTACNDEMEGKTFLTTDDLMIDDYIMQHDPEMTTFLDITDAIGFRGMIHAYGTYTCFIPTNEAIDNYAKASGKSSWKDFSNDELEKMVKFHIVRDTITTAEFVDGRLRTATMLAKYLTTKTEEAFGGNGVAIRVNRQGVILEKDIAVANGFIHKIGEVLTPAPLTCGQSILNLPDSYSLFKSVMQETGWTDSLSHGQTENSWNTVFLQSDVAFASSGINNKAQLLARLEEARPDILDSDSLLWTFAAYHCTKGLYYVADLTSVSALQSLAPNQALTFKLSKDTVIVNEYRNVATNTFEPGIAVSKQSDFTDFSCSNGVLIDLNGNIEPKKRKAQAVYWDIAEQPELVKMKEFRKQSITGIQISTLSEFRITTRSSVTTINYSYSGSYGANGQYVNNDNLTINFNRFSKIEMTLPLLTEGTYNVWLAWRRGGSGDKIRTTFLQEGQDDQVLNNIIDLSEYNSTSLSAEALLAGGRKRYTAKERNTAMNCRLIGTIVVQSTGRHTLMFESINQAKAADTYLDMIHFIPVDDDQIWPRFDMAGNAIYPGTACEEIWPADKACSADNDVY